MLKPGYQARFHSSTKKFQSMLRSCFSENTEHPDCARFDRMQNEALPEKQTPSTSDKHTERSKFLTYLIINAFVFVSLFTIVSTSSIAQDGSRSKDSSAGETAAAAGADGKTSADFSKPYGFYLNPLLDHLQANADQRVKISAILQSYRGRLEPLRNDYNVKRQEFLSNVVKGVSSDVIMGQQIKISNLYEEICSHYCQMSLEVRRVLTDEQIVRYEEFKRQRGWTRKSK